MVTVCRCPNLEMNTRLPWAYMPEVSAANATGNETPNLLSNTVGDCKSVLCNDLTQA